MSDTSPASTSVVKSLSVSESDCVHQLLILGLKSVQVPYLLYLCVCCRKATESISERLNFLGGHAPRPPLGTAHFARIALGPPTGNKEPPHSRIRLRAWYTKSVGVTPALCEHISNWTLTTCMHMYVCVFKHSLYTNLRMFLHEVNK